MIFLSVQRQLLVFQKKCCLSFWSTHPLAFQKLVLIKILGNFPLKHSFFNFSFEYIYRPSRFAKNHLLWEVHIHFRDAKETCITNFRRVHAEVYASDHIPHMMKFGLAIYVYSVFGSWIYVILNKKWKVYKDTIRSAMYSSVLNCREGKIALPLLLITTPSFYETSW